VEVVAPVAEAVPAPVEEAVARVTEVPVPVTESLPGPADIPAAESLPLLQVGPLG
jgi:hypothetical protein